MEIFSNIINYGNKFYLYVYENKPEYLYVVAFFCALYFLVSLIRVAIKKRNRKNLVNKVRKHNSLHCMTWLNFEHFVAEYFTRKGYKVITKGGAKADGGIDLVIKKWRKKYIVQVKHYAVKNKVSISLIREMLGVFTSEQEKMALSGVIIVTSSSFSRPAIDFARQNNVILVSGIDLLKFIG